MEFVRIVKNKKFMAAVILLLLLNCVFFYWTQQNSMKDLGLNARIYTEQFRQNAELFTAPDAKEKLQEKSAEFQVLKSFAESEKLKAENPQEYAYYVEEEAALIRENPKLYEEYQSGKYSYDELAAAAEFYAHFANLAAYQSGYGAYIDGVVENGRELSARSLFSDKDSFSYRSIQKAMADFSKNKGLTLSLVNDLPVTAVLNYQTGDFLLILLCIFLVIHFVPEKNVALLTGSCKNGRRMQKIRQVPILFGFSLFCALAVFLCEFCIAAKIYDAPLALSAPIQSADIFKDCVLTLNFLQLFAVVIVFKAAVAVMIAVLIWLLISLSGNILLVSGIAGVIAVAELLFYKNISAQSTVSFLKTFNLFSLFDFKSITEYNLISFFGAPVRAELLIWEIVLTTVFLLFVSVILSAKRSYPVKSPPKAAAFFGVLLQKVRVFYFKVQSAVYAGRFETYKLLHSGKGLLVIGAFLLILALGLNTNVLIFSPKESFLNDYYEEYGGVLSDAVYESMEKMQTECEAVQAEFDQKAAQFKNGALSLEEYEMAKAKNEAYDTQREAVAALQEQVSRIEPLQEKGITPVLINETGYNALFSPQADQTEILLLLCAVCVLFSGVFPIEKESNMQVLNHCAKHGRSRLWRKKILAAVPAAFVLTAVSYLFYVLQAAHHYKLKHLNADIHNLHCLENVNLSVTILEYMLLNFAFLFVFVVVAALSTAALSTFFSRLVTIILTSCVFVLPGALSMAGVASAAHISAPSLLNLNSVAVQNGLGTSAFLPHFALIIIAAALLLLSGRSFCKTKGS